jgi:hypothetical protein
MRTLRILILCILLSSAVWGQARQGGGNRGNAATGIDWNKPFPAHKIIGNVYFVGSEQLGSSSWESVSLNAANLTIAPGLVIIT